MYIYVYTYRCIYTFHIYICVYIYLCKHQKNIHWYIWELRAWALEKNRPSSTQPCCFLACVTLGKLVNLSVPGNAHLENEYKLHGTCLTKLN